MVVNGQLLLMVGMLVVILVVMNGEPTSEGGNCGGGFSGGEWPAHF